MQLRKVNYTPRMIASLIAANEITFDNPIQRGLVWKRPKKSLFIHSLVLEYPVGTIYANKTGKVHDIFDGKQRLTSINEYMNGDYKLSKVPELLLVNGGIRNLPTMVYSEFPQDIQDEIMKNIHVTDDFKKTVYSHYPGELKAIIREKGQVIDLSGKSFSELQLDFQEKISNYNLDVHVYENMSQAEVAVLFDRLNSGKPLTAAEKSKAQVLSPLQLQHLENHEIFSYILNLESKKRKAAVPYVMQAYSILFSENKCLLSNAIRDILSRSELTPEKEYSISQCFDVYCDVYKNLSDSSIDKKINRVLKSKSHFASLLLIAEKVTRNNLNSIVFLEWLRYFFNSNEMGNTTISMEYNSKLKDATNSAESVQSRLNAVDRSFSEFVQNFNMNEVG